MNTTKIDYYQLAAEFYQRNPLPDNYAEMRHDELISHLEENALEPFEHYKGEDIAELIYNLEQTFQYIAK